MPTPTYFPLANITLGSSASSVTFSSIPATYRDLVLVFDGAATAILTGVIYRFNGDSGSNYSTVRALGYEGNVISSAFTGTSLTILGSNEGLGTQRSNAIVHIMDYSATDKHKTALNRNNNNNSAGNHTEMTAGRWANTAAVNSITITSTNPLAATTTFALYGIAS